MPTQPRAKQELQRILVVDDERVIADTLGVILRQAGFAVDVAYSGTEGVERARSIRPSLILSDVVMPDMNGIEMAIRVSKEQPDCRILLFSGQAASADLLNSARSQGYDFHIIAKPVHPQDLIQYIRKSVSALNPPPRSGSLTA